MSESSRPRYVPNRHRRKQNQRFHGAFTGGFSAGFYNTVGSKEGWKPREEVEESHGDENDNTPLKRSRPQQRLEDFMDEQDHANWGGPSSIRRDYKDQDSASSTMRSGAQMNSAESTIENWMKIAVEPPANVGNRLLRVLGWREENSSAYVPSKDPAASNVTNLPEAKVVLSKKRLRKVQLQQERVKIPPPKLDTAGLGFEPYENAPEFKAYREKRRKQAQQRAKLGQHTRDVYRVSNVLDGSDDDLNGSDRNNRQGTNKKADKQHNDTEDAYVSYETIEDFVGSKSVGGFALREDEDDAYDDEPMSLTKGSNKVRLNKEDYNHEIYEHHSSDDEGNHQDFHNPMARKGTVPTHGSDLAGVLSSFAGIGGSGGVSTGNEKPNFVGVTADGRPPLAGFALGGAFTSHSMPKRYRGPDVPLSYEVKRHEFGPNENPLVLKALSRAVQLEVVDEKRQQAMEEALLANASSVMPSRFRGQARNNVASSAPTERSTTPMAGGAFAGLADAMKSRFTSVLEKASDPSEAGLRVPVKGRSPAPTDQTTTANTTDNEKKEVAPKEIKIRRTVLQFAPDRLLCKRFHVPVPAGSTHVAAGAAGGGRITEACYFKGEILNPAAAGRDNPQARAQQKAKATKKPGSGLRSILNEDGTLKEDAIADENLAPYVERPPKEIYKSIFEPQSDEGEDSGSDEAEKTGHDADTKATIASNCEEAATANRAERVEAEPKGETINRCVVSNGKEEPLTTAKVEDTTLVRYDGDEKKKKKRRKEGKRSRSDSEDDSDSDRRPRRRKKRSRSVSSDSTNLSHDSASTDDRRKERKKHRDRKQKKKKHRHKKKKSKRR